MRALPIIATLALGAAGVAVLGPRERVRWPEEQDVEVPEAAKLDVWLQGRERALGDVRPRTEKRVVWHRGQVATTTVAVVYVHGFSASRQETAPVAERVAVALSANLFETRLVGHGRTGEALAEAEASDWIRDYREAISIGRRIGKKVVLIGCSTGATLDAVMASHWPDRAVRAHVWLSPNFGAQEPSARVLTWPWARVWVPLVAGSRRTWEPVNEDQGRYWTTDYPIEALFPMQAMVDAARAAQLDRIREPVLVIHSENDPVVRPEAIRRAFSRLGSATKEIESLKDARDPHVLAGDIMSPNMTDFVVDRTVTFLEGVLPP